MALRALSKLTHATIHTMVVAAGQTVTAGLGVRFASADDECQAAGVNDDASFGIALQSATAGEQVDVALFGPVVPVLVGTGGATRGVKAQGVADGYADAAAHNSDGTNNSSINGIFMQSGAVGDLIGMQAVSINRGN